MYKIGDRIAHPLHGAGTISAIESRRINGTNRDYYLMHIPVGDMTVMIPTETCTIIGIRPVIDAERAEAILDSIPEIEVSDNSNWNKRYRENMLRIRSGDLLEVAAVIKSLVYRDNERGLSTGERKMLHSAKQIFISELVIAQNIAYEEAENRLYSAIG
ncbi:MAG: CarD family transcriptional regulator [Oscillospiraceae bacterium]|nr:CarD family transcriptional regulator [Oscillospiraceae bacterium]